MALRAYQSFWKFWPFIIFTLKSSPYNVLPPRLRWLLPFTPSVGLLASYKRRKGYWENPDPGSFVIGFSGIRISPLVFNPSEKESAWQSLSLSTVYSHSPVVRMMLLNEFQSPVMWGWFDSLSFALRKKQCRRQKAPLWLGMANGSNSCVISCPAPCWQGSDYTSRSCLAAAQYEMPVTLPQYRGIFMTSFFCGGSQI